MFGPPSQRPLAAPPGPSLPSLYLLFVLLIVEKQEKKTLNMQRQRYALKKEREVQEQEEGRLTNRANTSVVMLREFCFSIIFTDAADTLFSFLFCILSTPTAIYSISFLTQCLYTTRASPLNAQIATTSSKQRKGSMLICQCQESAPITRRAN